MNLSTRITSSIRTIPDFPKPGIQFKDITPLLTDPILCSDIADALVDPFRSESIDVIAGVESRGFIFGLMMAQRLNCAFALIRKKGKLPGKTIELKYDLEYGSAAIEMHEDAIKPFQNVLIHDDLLATGGTAGAASELIGMNQAVIKGYSFVVELGFLRGSKNLQPYSSNIVSLLKY
jgi:adenine phosphoribosyltransferase